MRGRIRRIVASGLLLAALLAPTFESIRANAAPQKRCLAVTRVKWSCSIVTPSDGLNRITIALVGNMMWAVDIDGQQFASGTTPAPTLYRIIYPGQHTVTLRLLGGNGIGVMNSAPA